MTPLPEVKRMVQSILRAVDRHDGTVTYDDRGKQFFIETQHPFVEDPDVFADGAISYIKQLRPGFDVTVKHEVSSEWSADKSDASRVFIFHFLFSFPAEYTSYVNELREFNASISVEALRVDLPTYAEWSDVS